MILDRIIKNREKRKKVAHIGAGIVIFIHAYEKYESAHNSYILFAIAGFVFLTIAFFHSVIAKKAPWVDGVFFIIEGILSVVVAFDYFHMGKKALPITYLLLAVFQFFMAFKKSKKGLSQQSSPH
jgi:chromate transport protein ChrA